MKINNHELTERQELFLKEYKIFKNREVTEQEFISGWNKFSKGRTWMFVRGMDKTPGFDSKSYKAFFTEYNEAATQYGHQTV